ncbi:ATP-dependent RNA helicase [Trichoderma ghanense]|uniref:ATP-dependent RNA helicase n=1 Tax=Trichoderma ghanense TaxID=65468 RepID=A0ABY2H3B9_9HYPO
MWLGLYELGGAWVKFDGGALVSKVAFASDFSAVEIRNLPQSSTVPFVQEVLEDVGMPTQGLDIGLFEQTAGNRYNAIVQAEDHTFAKVASSKLATYITYRDLQVFPVPPSLPASQSPQVDCRVVHCSWARPTRSAKLLFSTEDAANRLQKMAMDGTYRVLGSRVEASVEGSEDRWIVQITGLSETTEASDVVTDIPESDRPLKVLVKVGDYACDLEYHASVVKAMLQRFGPVTRWVLPPSSDTQRFHAYGLFQEESMARNAAAALHEKLLPFGKATTLSVSIVASVRFKVLGKIYEWIRPRIVAQKAVWEREQTYFHEGRPGEQFRCLRLEGEDHESVARARKFVEKAMSGDIVRVEAKNLRSCKFLAQDESPSVIGSLEWACKVLIIPDLRRSLFRVYGDDELDQKTVEAIATVLQKRIPESHIIDLNGVDFKWASMGGFKYLNSQLTQEALLGVSAEGPQLFIMGPRADYNRAMAIIGRKMTASRQKDPTSGMNCPACFCEPEDPIRMSCGHIYCGACFVRCCEAEMRASREFQIRCPTGTARGGLCGKAFSLTELQEALPSEIFEQALKKSFESYVSRRPAALAYCATPDCDQVYRITPPDSDHAGIFTCNKCLRSVCTICQDSHPEGPCTGLGRDANSVLSKKTKEQLGIKDCPRCSRMMEKSDGCDHMTCSCGAHVCWVCLSFFDTSAECYNHLQRVHRGIYFH